MSQIYGPGDGGGGSGIIQTIDGDTGSITGAVVTIYANQAAKNSGQTVQFVNSGTVSTLNVTDASANTLIGQNAGNAITSGGIGNTSLGVSSLNLITNGDYNVGIGFGALDATSTGSFNIGLGQYAGDNYGGAESSNILFNSYGVASEDNTLRIGDGTGTGAQQLNAAFIQGVYSNTQAISGTVEYVTIDNTTGQLGVTATASGSITLNPDTSYGSPVSGTSINIQAYSDPNIPNACGSSVVFYGDIFTTPQTLVLFLTDDLGNTILGYGSGNGTLVSTLAENNVALGNQNLTSLTSGARNVAIGGTNVMSSMEDGDNNIAIGSGSLSLSISDLSNIAIGTSCLSIANGSSNDNVGVGHQAIQNLTSGSQNVGIGSQSLNSLNSGSGNVALGYRTLFSSTNDDTNVGIGHLAAFSINGTSDVVAVGAFALTSSVSDAGNTAVGYQSLNLLNGGENCTAVGKNALLSSTADSDNCAFGYNCLSNLDGGSGNVGVGSQSQQSQALGSNNVSVGNESLFSSTNTSNAVAIGAFSLYNATTGGNNSVAVGYGALGDSDANSNVAVGYNAATSASTDIELTAVGTQALEGLNGGGSCTAIGYQAMKDSSTGQSSVAIGVSALLANDGSQNIAIGNYSSSSAGANSNNIAIGHQSLLSNVSGLQNCAIGTDCLHYLAIGDNNVAIGLQSMFLATNAYYNTCLGTLTLANLLTGNYNLALGYIAGDSYVGAETSNIVINSAGVVGDNNILRIGDTTGGGYNGITAAYVQGIYNNTQAPSATVEYVTIDNTTGQLGVTTASGTVTFTGDIGTPFTTNSVTIAGDTTANRAGGSVVFNAISPELRLEFTNGTLSTFLGRGAGNNTPFGAANCVAVGYNSQASANSGSSNCSLGRSTLAAMPVGAYNLALGDQSGAQYNNDEQSNILLNCAINAAAGENNTLHIGDGTGTGNQQLSTAYICGIANATITSITPTPYLTLTDTSSDQVVCLTPVPANTASSTFGSLAVATALQNTATYPILVNVSVEVSAATGAVILVGVDDNATPTAQAVTATFSGAGTYNFSFVVPSSYYAEVTTSGTITVGSITTFATQIG